MFMRCGVAPTPAAPAPPGFGACARCGYLDRLFRCAPGPALCAGEVAPRRLTASRNGKNHNEHVRPMTYMYGSLTQGVGGGILFWIHTLSPHHLILNSVIDPKG